MNTNEQLKELYLSANEIRNDVLDMLKFAGSGHLGGSFSESEILSTLFNYEMKIDSSVPNWSKRDRFILSKGHANPGLYSILSQKGFFSKSEFQHLRKIGGLLQGHPEIFIPGVEYIAGFLGQGLSAGSGMALGFKKFNLPNRVFVLIGDGDNLEGQTWEAARFAVHNKLDNLIAIFDYNNILSDGNTDDVLTIKEPEKQWSSFGWNVIVIDGHDISQIIGGLKIANETKSVPTIIIAHTKKGHGVSIWENSALSHGSWGPSDEDYKQAKQELANQETQIHSNNFLKNPSLQIVPPSITLGNNYAHNWKRKSPVETNFSKTSFDDNVKISLREAFGKALTNLGQIYDNFDVFDADVKSGTMVKIFEDFFPERFIQCGIAEQNMFSMAAGYHLATNRIPVVTTYAVFTSLLAAAQFRNGVALQNIPLIVASSHVGIDTGPDGPTHQAIEDLGIFSSYPNVQVLSPCDPHQIQAVTEAALCSKKPTYIRTGRSPVPTIYPKNIKYEIGNDTILHDGSDVSIFATGIMVHRALESKSILANKGINAEIIDITSIAPLDERLILKSIKKTNCALTAEDHFIHNGLGSKITQFISNEYPTLTANVAIRKYAESGSPESLATKYGINVNNIVESAEKLVKKK